ncbi:hypothetical protein NZK35_32815 [Stieleria sp. ICT_E10.1]|uniref:hypothetical protein n=1 Tax=Stieleria sedimenti TaxID=2976331 RepID=UPI00217FADA2|nr:hypothetical protein [Stieleria sedimenti]MCS7471455.1 hypothetical protein [Stieleria sedimenti]
MITLGKNLAKCVLLLLALPVLGFFAFILPFIGLYFVSATMYSLVYQLTRRRANPFLVSHLDRICNFIDTTEEFEQCVVKHGRLKFGQRYESCR